MLLLITSCDVKSKESEQISMSQDEVVTNCCLSDEGLVSEDNIKQMSTQDVDDSSSDNLAIYSFKGKYYYTLTDTIDQGYEIKALRMRSFEPEDYEGPQRFPEDDIYGNEKVYNLYHYGNRGKITIKSITDSSYTDSVYITRDLIAEKLGFSAHPDINIKMYGLGDEFTYKGIRNDSIIIEYSIGIMDSGVLVPFDMKFKLGDKAENFDVQEITNKWTWDDN